MADEQQTVERPWIICEHHSSKERARQMLEHPENFHGRVAHGNNPPITMVYCPACLSHVAYLNLDGCLFVAEVVWRPAT